jgi:hypothetical protein
MKSEVLNSLLTARTLFDAARKHCFVRDRHVASAGLVVLQDAVELAFYACLIERGIDEVKTIEKLGFDELIGELKKAGIAVPKSGTLKAMNKQRVLVKHHAQLAEPAAVANYYKAGLFAVDAVLKEVIGTSLHHVVVADAIADSEAKGHIGEASRQIERRQYFDAMVSTRKALFLAVEREYDIKGWADYDPSKPLTFLTPSLAGTPDKAPYYTRNKEWIQKNVKDPLGYIHLDHAQVRADMTELGIDPEEFFNVWRLTPAVYNLGEQVWAIKKESRIACAATEDNARYCLDVVVAILVSQQSRKSLQRWSQYRSWNARLHRQQTVLSRASSDADATGVTLEAGDVCSALYSVSDFSGQNQFVYIFKLQNVQEDSSPLLGGYIPSDSCEIEERVKKD